MIFDKFAFVLSIAAAGAVPCAAATLSGDAAAALTHADAQQSDSTERLVRQVQQAWFQSEWKDYQTRFVTADGRVVDNGNSNVSHSEGQGYGMLLATIAKDRKAFETIWNWTDHHLFVRRDALAAWKWDGTSKTVVDTNNATDGDLLIAWALARAAVTFAQPQYRERARAIALAVGHTLVTQTSYGPTLLPGAFGFKAENQPDGPIVNLSYLVFPAFEALAPIAPEVDWSKLKATGLRLIEDSRFGPLRLPSDWVSLAGPQPQPARNFKPTFGYDAIRIPLYLAWIGSAEAKTGRFATLRNEEHNIGPFVIDVATGAAERPIDGAGFRLIAAMSRCLAQGTTLPQALIGERDTFYYPATLRLLSMALIEERYPACL